MKTHCLFFLDHFEVLAVWLLVLVSGLDISSLRVHEIWGWSIAWMINRCEAVLPNFLFIWWQIWEVLRIVIIVVIILTLYIIISIIVTSPQIIFLYRVLSLYFLIIRWAQYRLLLSWTYAIKRVLFIKPCIAVHLVNVSGIAAILILIVV